MKYFSPQAMNPSAQALEKRKRSTPTAMATGTWTSCEHNGFLVAIELFPQGPWNAIAKYVGTRTPRQAQTHAQKYREKLIRLDIRMPLGRHATKANSCDQDAVIVQVVAIDVVAPQDDVSPICVLAQDFLFDPEASMDDAMSFLVDLVDCVEWNL